MKEKSSLSGKLIAVEGLDGSGKSTQIHLLYKWLEGMDIKVFFSEWNSSELVKDATSKGKKRQLLTPTTFSLIHGTDFTDRYERQILPMLEGGYIVLCDRYIFTSFARDGARGCDADWLRKMYSFVFRPDITFYFKVPVSVALSRILAGRPQLKYFEAGMDLNLSTDVETSFRIFSEMTSGQYDSMIEEFGFEVIDATLQIHEQQNLVRKIVAEQIDLPSYKKTRAVAL